MKKIVLFVLLSLSFLSKAQFHAVNYDFEANAQSLQYNPGVDYPYSKLFAIPFISNTSVFAGNTGFSLQDLFAPNTSFEKKVYSITDKLTNTDFILANYRQDLFSYGWTDDLDRFKYFGVYWEFDHFTNIPADLIRLGRDGNQPHLFEKYDTKYLATKTDFIQTIYFGINKKPNRKLSIGYRFKLYSGIANVQSVGNNGQFYTTEGNNNYYVHHLDNIDLQLQSSSLPDNPSTSNITNKFLFSKNYGPGFDAGFTYQYSDKLYFSGSLLDLGFIYYTSNIRNYSAKGSYKYEGPKLQFPENSLIDYWKNFKTEFENGIVKDENSKPYISYRPTTLYLGLKYGMGNLNQQDCSHFMNLKTEHTSFLGLTGYAQYRPIKIHLGVSAYYEQKWSKYFYTKVNVTADNYNYASLGAGMVLNAGRFQVYVAADNLLGLSDLSSSKKQALYLGLNIIKFK